MQITIFYEHWNWQETWLFYLDLYMHIQIPTSKQIMRASFYKLVVQRISESCICKIDDVKNADLKEKINKSIKRVPCPKYILKIHAISLSKHY